MVEVCKLSALCSDHEGINHGRKDIRNKSLLQNSTVVACLCDKVGFLKFHKQLNKDSNSQQSFCGYFLLIHDNPVAWVFRISHIRLKGYKSFDFHRSTRSFNQVHLLSIKTNSVPPDIISSSKDSVWS